MKSAITHHNYMPVIKWRQGEYQALLRLGDAQKNAIVPLIEVTPPDFDFELWQPKKTIDDHLDKFAARLAMKWGPRLGFVDVGLLDPTTRMSGAEHPLSWLLNEVREYEGNLIPVIRLDDDFFHRAAIHDANEKDRKGVALRCTLEEASDADFNGNVESLLDALGCCFEDLDLIIDLKSPHFQPINGLAQIIVHALSVSAAFERSRSVTLLATAFPASMAQITGPLQVLPREEWLLYKELIALLPSGNRRPTFGDYGVASHGLPQGDMRFLKPSATVRYTVTDGWIVAKGSNVRDNGYEQYRGCCRVVIDSGSYLGANFSPGSAYIDGCRAGREPTGNLTTWRWVGTNHHITKVVHDISSFYGS